ncbi:MAG TPA: PP2C family serine/threonine-protein phosphatase [Gallionella sp.]|nr:PP2C family serine/threonine-protein phosphatase [Gallionella sp.]
MSRQNYRFTSSARSDTGARDNQEDRYHIDRISTVGDIAQEPWLCIVSDGMGGHAHGEIASRIAVLTFKAEFHRLVADGMPVSDALNEAINLANHAVVHEAQGLVQLRNMGATMVALAVESERLHWVCTGDSRLYLIRNGKIHQESRDFTLEQDLREGIESGRIAPDSLGNNQNLQALTSFIGLDQGFRHAAGNIVPSPGDYLILCTDGIYGSIPQGQLAQCCTGTSSETISRIFDRCLIPSMDDDQDNATAVVLKVEADTANTPLETDRSNDLKFGKAKSLRAVAGAMAFLFAGMAIGAVFAANRLDRPLEQLLSGADKAGASVNPVVIRSSIQEPPHDSPASQKPEQIFADAPHKSIKKTVPIKRHSDNKASTDKAVKDDPKVSKTQNAGHNDAAGDAGDVNVKNPAVLPASSVPPTNTGALI